MFVQVMEGRVGNREGLHAQSAAWMSDLQPGADGWLAAKANSDRPEQGAWWADRADAGRLMSLMQVDRYVDLPDPMLYSR